MKPTTCKKCGQPDLIWAKSKKGNWYLGTDEALAGEYRTIKARFVRAHNCEEWIANAERDLRDFIENQVGAELTADHVTDYPTEPGLDRKMFAALFPELNEQIQIETDKRFAAAIADKGESK